MPAHPKSTSDAFIVSATRIETFELCKRKYWFRESHGLSSGTSEAQAFGTALHAVAERFLKADDLGRDATGKPVDLYPAGWDAGLTPGEALLIRRLISRGIEEGTLERLPGRKIETEFSEELHPADVNAPAVILHGTIDYEMPHGIQDHKTAKNARYAKSPAKLAVNTQLLTYGYQVVKKRPDLEQITLRHNVFLKEEVKTRKVETTVPRQAILDNWHRITGLAREMRRLSTIPLARWTDIPAAEDEVSACQAYGGCPYRSICGGRETPENYKRRTDQAKTGNKEMPKGRTWKPSPRHVFRYLQPNSDTQWCDRCARSFVPLADTFAPIECVPTQAWLASHPEDDGGTTENKEMTPFAAPKAPAAPAPAAPPAAPAAAINPPAAPAAPEPRYWVTDPNTRTVMPVTKTRAEVVALLATLGDVPVMLEGSNVWKKASEYGIAAAPAAPAGPVPPWAVAACPACKGTGWNSKGSPCRICDAERAKTNGPQSAHFDITTTDAGITWTAKPVTQTVATPPAAPAAPVALNPELAALQAEKLAELNGAPAAPAPTPAAPDASGNVDPAPKRRGRPPKSASAPAGVAPVATPAPVYPVSVSATAATSAAAPGVGFMLLVNCSPEKGCPHVVNLEDEMAEAGQQLAAASGKESYYDLPAFDRRDALAKHARDITQGWNGAAVTVRTDTPDVKALVAALRPLATVVIGGFGQ